MKITLFIRFFWVKITRAVSISNSKIKHSVCCWQKLVLNIFYAYLMVTFCILGYPVMIKASAGGGGKGMRIAWNDKEAM